MTPGTLADALVQHPWHFSTTSQMASTTHLHIFSMMTLSESVTLSLDLEVASESRERYASLVAPIRREETTNSFQEFTLGMFDGVTGVVTQPYRGAQKEGVTGFSTGVGKGLGGLVFKTSAGSPLPIPPFPFN
jgi:hypothetical protein